MGADWLAIVLALARLFTARPLAHQGMPDAGRERGEDDGQEGDDDACPADRPLMGGKAREEDDDPRPP